jgi:hypothetical protein
MTTHRNLPGKGETRRPDKTSGVLQRLHTGRKVAAQQRRSAQSTDVRGKRRFGSPEYRLVLYMLLTLFALVLAVLLIPPVFAETTVDSEFLENLFEYRRTVLAVIITAFGAWVGAGAAYFFGRENLREATSKILEMSEPSAGERLRRTPVRDIPPRPLDWQPKKTTKLKDILERLRSRPEYWFIPIFNEDDSIVTVLEEEVFWRYLYDVKEKEEGLGQKTLDEVTEELLARDLGTLISHAEADKRLKQEFHDIYVRCSMSQSAGDVYREMQLRERPVRLAIVLDDLGKPTHFFTTTEVRQLLLEIA